ncbi:MAG: hypothetical protein U0Z44_03280 [Kouleothrix sp.]
MTLGNGVPRSIIAVGDLVWDVLVKPDGILLPGGDTTGRIALAPGTRPPMWQPGSRERL